MDGRRTSARQHILCGMSYVSCCASSLACRVPLLECISMRVLSSNLELLRVLDSDNTLLSCSAPNNT